MLYPCIKQGCTNVRLKWMICEDVNLCLQRFLGWHKQSWLCESVKYARWFLWSQRRTSWAFTVNSTVCFLPLFTFLCNCECTIVCTTCLNNSVLAAAEHLLSSPMLWQRAPASSTGLEWVNVRFVEKSNTYSLCEQQIRHVTANVLCCNTTADEGMDLEEVSWCVHAPIAASMCVCLVRRWRLCS